MEKSEDGVLRLTEAELDAARTLKGGWTAKTLAGWGVPWPAPHGWKKALLKGEPIPAAGGAKPTPRPTASDGAEPDHKALLHLVVMAVVNAGRGDILNGIDDLNAYYKTHIPTVADIVGDRPETAMLTGGLEWEDKVYSFNVTRVVKRGDRQRGSVAPADGSI